MSLSHSCPRAQGGGMNGWLNWLLGMVLAVAVILGVPQAARLVYYPHGIQVH